MLREESLPSDFSMHIVILHSELMLIVYSKGSWLDQLPRCSPLKIIMKNSTGHSPNEIQRCACRIRMHLHPFLLRLK